MGQGSVIPEEFGRFQIDSERKLPSASYERNYFLYHSVLNFQNSLFLLYIFFEE